MAHRRPSRVFVFYENAISAIHKGSGSRRYEEKKEKRHKYTKEQNPHLRAFDWEYSCHSSIPPRDAKTDSGRGGKTLMKFVTGHWEDVDGGTGCSIINEACAERP